MAVYEGNYSGMISFTYTYDNLTCEFTIQVDTSGYAWRIYESIGSSYSANNLHFDDFTYDTTRSWILEAEDESISLYFELKAGDDIYQEQALSLPLVENSGGDDSGGDSGDQEPVEQSITLILRGGSGSYQVRVDDSGNAPYEDYLSDGTYTFLGYGATNVWAQDTTTEKILEFVPDDPYYIIVDFNEDENLSQISVSINLVEGQFYEAEDIAPSFITIDLYDNYNNKLSSVDINILYDGLYYIGSATILLSQETEIGTITSNDMSIDFCYIDKDPTTGEITINFGGIITKTTNNNDDEEEIVSSSLIKIYKDNKWKNARMVIYKNGAWVNVTPRIIKTTT